MKTIAERIKECLELKQMKQVDIIERTGINKGALSSYISGKYEPKQNNIYKIAKALDVNEAWLMGYDVPMEKPPSIQRIDRMLDESKVVSLAVKNTNDDSDILLDTYYLLNKTGKKEALKRIFELTQIPTYCDHTKEFNKINSVEKQD